MSRWPPDTRERLRQAAFELFAEQGFAETTVPAITARAGLTTRTFFRHFADKREVLFTDDAEVPAMVERMMTEAPASASPMTVVLEGLRTVAETRFEPRKAAIRQLRELVRSDDGLRERDLRKRAAMADAVRQGFLTRGLDGTRAALLAETCVTLVYVAMTEWLDSDRALYDIIRDTAETLRAELG
ncbi:TetR/AcrR family transcriptional regulator [Actinophytocola gossypii]|uniref:TetR family transcriptional regulator n=1 Tax=Actinophytocola gossypii TaxID=2812003 RepID=A0ABT2J4Y9_9PSEU|nr:TetR/AcrR family transcriptional regulator [Actinophytocola gossypii]MCT2582920.1 TetR family transcriptional regulator [Actinophytocola gossypii]